MSPKQRSPKQRPSGRRRAGAVEVGVLCGSAVVIGAGALVKETRLPGAELIHPTEAPTASAALVLPAGATLPTDSSEAQQTHVGCDIEDRGMGDYVEVPSATPFPAKVYVPAGVEAGAYT